LYRDNRQVLTHKEHRFILNHGALGDMITSLPAIIHARTTIDPILKMIVYVAPWQVDLVKHLLAPYGEFDVESIATVPLGKKERMEKWGEGAPNSMNAAIANTHTRNRVHMVDYAFNFLIDARPETMAQRSYPVLAPLGPRAIEGKYIVVPIGATSDNKLFRASVMTPILQWALDAGYTPVIVGTKMSHTRAEMGEGKLSDVLQIRDQADLIPAEIVAKCVDMREKTTLLELRDLLGHAAAVIGVDGGTLHLAGTTDTNIIFASGTTLPKHRYIARFGDPQHKIRYVGPRDLECAGCQSNWTLTRWDFRECAYGDNACMELLHPDDFIAGLKQLGL
jgi:ADP-heptose:LPS heptosyltransferase